MYSKETNSNNLNRRHWLQMSLMSVAAIYMPPFLSAKNLGKPNYQYHLANSSTHSFSLPINKKIPFNWSSAELTLEGNPIGKHLIAILIKIFNFV
jgi:hypothetical protein